MVPIDSIPGMFGLSGSAVLLLLALEYHCRNRAHCFPSNKRLASLVGCSTRQITNALADLQREGWIRLHFKGASKRREKIVMLRRIDPARPAETGENVDGTTVPSNQANDRSIARGMSTNDPKGSEEARRTYSAHAAQHPRVRGRLNRSAGGVRATRVPILKDSRKPIERDPDVLEYARVAGTTPPASPWSDPVAEPFQAPAV